MSSKGSLCQGFVAAIKPAVFHRSLCHCLCLERPDLLICSPGWTTQGQMVALAKQALAESVVLTKQESDCQDGCISVWWIFFHWQKVMPALTFSRCQALFHPMNESTKLGISENLCAWHFPASTLPLMTGEFAMEVQNKQWSSKPHLLAALLLGS